MQPPLVSQGSSSTKTISSEMRRLVAQCLARALPPAQCLRLAHQLQERRESAHEQGAEATYTSPSSSLHPAAKPLVHQLHNALVVPRDVLRYMQASVVGVHSESNQGDRSSLSARDSRLMPPSHLLVALLLCHAVEPDAYRPEVLVAVLDLLAEPIRQQAALLTGPLAAASIAALACPSSGTSQRADAVGNLLEALLGALSKMSATAHIAAPQAVGVLVDFLQRYGVDLLELALAADGLDSADVRKRLSTAVDALQKVHQAALTRWPSIYSEAIETTLANMDARLASEKHELHLTRPKGSRGKRRKVSSSGRSLSSPHWDDLTEAFEEEFAAAPKAAIPWPSMIADEQARSSSEVARAQLPMEAETITLLSHLSDPQTSWEWKLHITQHLLAARLADATHHAEGSGPMEGRSERIHSAFYLSLLHHASLALLRILEGFEKLPKAGPTGTGVTSETATAGPSVRRVLAMQAQQMQAVLCGLIPSLVAAIEERRLENFAHSGKAPDVSAIVARALRSLLTRNDDVLQRCESLSGKLSEAEKVDRRSTVAVAAAEAAESSMNRPEDEDMLAEYFDGETSSKTRSLWRALLTSFMDRGLCTQDVVRGTPHALHHAESHQRSADGDASLASEAAGTATPLAEYIERQLRDESMAADVVRRTVRDYGAQKEASIVVLQVLRQATAEGDLETLARVCRALQAEPDAVSAITLYVPALELLNACGALMDRDDLGQSGEEPSALSAVLLFLQTLVKRAQAVLEDPASLADRLDPSLRALPTFLRNYSLVRPLAELSAFERDLVERWIHALFDSEGIPDELIRASSPAVMLSLAPLLFSQSIGACQAGLIDLDTLKGGLAYFLQDVLSYALPVALHWLLAHVARTPLARYPGAAVEGAAASGAQVGGDAAEERATSASVAGSSNHTRSVCLDLLWSLTMTAGPASSGGGGGGSGGGDGHGSPTGAVGSGGGGCPVTVLELIAPQLLRLVRDRGFQAATVGSDMDLAQTTARIEAVAASAGVGCAASVRRWGLVAPATWMRPMLGAAVAATDEANPRSEASVLRGGRSRDAGGSHEESKRHDSSGPDPSQDPGSRREQPAPGPELPSRPTPDEVPSASSALLAELLSPRSDAVVAARPEAFLRALRQLPASELRHRGVQRALALRLALSEASGDARGSGGGSGDLDSVVVRLAAHLHAEDLDPGRGTGEATDGVGGGGGGGEMRVGASREASRGRRAGASDVIEAAVPPLASVLASLCDLRAMGLAAARSGLAEDGHEGATTASQARRLAQELAAMRKLLVVRFSQAVRATTTTTTKTSAAGPGGGNDVTRFAAGLARLSTCGRLGDVGADGVPTEAAGQGHALPATQPAEGSHANALVVMFGGGDAAASV